MTPRNGHYVCAENGGGYEVNVTRTAAAEWETFVVEVASAPAADAVAVPGTAAAVGRAESPAIAQAAPTGFALSRGAGPLADAGTGALRAADDTDDEAYTVGASGPYSPAPPADATASAPAPAHGLAPAPPTVTEIVEYYHVDALGSVRVVTDEAGALVRHHDFLPFGEEWQPEVPPSADKRLFAGKERDVESGLDYFGARYYRADLGRFTSVDPEWKLEDNLPNPQAWNRYQYVRNGPLSYVDPDGRNPLLVAGGIGAAVFGGWKVITNVRSGRPWYDNVGVEASKGLLVGVTLGLAAPAVAAADTAPVVANLAADSIAAAELHASGRIIANDLHHIFEKAGRGMEWLVEAYGSQAKAFGAVEQAATKALTAIGFTGGLFRIEVTIGQQVLVVRGNVIDGVVHVGTFFKGRPQ